ncbi:MAG: hypothetical protein AAFR38_03320 [Planctomycetota bacterium]
MQTGRFPTAAAFALAASTLATGCYSSMKFTEDRVYELDAPTELAVELKTRHGAVDVAPHGVPMPEWAERELGSTEPDPDRVLVLARLRTSKEHRLQEVVLEPEIELGTLHLEAEWPDKGRDGVGYVVRVPSRITAAQIRTGHGPVDLWSVDGPANVYTGHGGIELYEIAGEVEARSGHGGIYAEHLAGDAMLKTGHGTISATDVSGVLTARTGHGPIDVEDPGSTVLLRTGHGSIRFVGDDDHGSIDANTGHGNIELVTDSHLIGELTGRTGYGRVRFEMPNGNRIDSRRSATIQLDGPESASLTTGHGVISVRVRDGG